LSRAPGDDEATGSVQGRSRIVLTAFLGGEMSADTACDLCDRICMRRGKPVGATFLVAVTLGGAACSGAGPAPAGREPSVEPRNSAGDTAVAREKVGARDAAVAADPRRLAVGEPARGTAEPPAATADPPYDLAADIEARRREALEELGKRTVVEVVEDVFVVIAIGGGQALASGKAVTRHALRAYLNGRFSRGPKRAISLYLFADAAPYDKYCKQHWKAPCMSPFGFYADDERRMVMNVGPGIGTLTHELVHPMVVADFPDAPDWINEGIASLFEQPLFGAPGQIHGGKNWRHPRVLQAFRSKTERQYASLPGLFAMKNDVFRGPLEDLNYASARYVCQWLDQHNKLWPFFQRWRDNFAQDPRGEQAFREVVGKSPEEADDDWVRWVKRL
jgi:hypothetical protein